MCFGRIDIHSSVMSEWLEGRKKRQNDICDDQTSDQRFLSLVHIYNVVNAHAAVCTQI